MTRRQQVCALYTQGLSERGVAERLGMSCTFVHDTLVRCNVQRRGVCARSPEWQVQYDLRLAQGVALYMSGQTYAQVEQRLRINNKRLKAAVLRFGGELRVIRRKRAAAVAALPVGDSNV